MCIYISDIKVTVEYCQSPNNYRLKIDEGQWIDVEATLKDTERGLQLTTIINGKNSTVGLLMFDQQIHLYDEVNFKYFIIIV